MTSFYSEILFSLATLLVVFWGHWRVLTLNQVTATDSDRYAVFTIKRRLFLIGCMAFQTFLSAVFVLRWLHRHPEVALGPISVPVAFRTFSFNLIDVYLCIQVIWDIHARKLGAALTLADDRKRTIQKRRTDPARGDILP